MHESLRSSAHECRTVSLEIHPAPDVRILQFVGIFLQRILREAGIPNAFHLPMHRTDQNERMFMMTVPDLTDEMHQRILHALSRHGYTVHSRPVLTVVQEDLKNAV